MRSSMLWLKVKYQPATNLPSEGNISEYSHKRPFNVRDIDSKYVLVFIIATMILISIVRDTIQFKVGKTFNKTKPR
jgi:hypothetical protein